MPNDRGPWCPTRGYLDDGGAKPASAPAEAAAETPSPEAPAAAAPAPGGGGGGDQYWTPTRGYLGSGGGGAPAPAAAETPAEAPVADDAPAEVVTASREAPAEEAPAEESVAVEVPELPEEDPLRESITTVDSMVEGEGFKEFSQSIFTEPDSETTLYRVSALNVAFAISSAALLIITLAVFWQDYDRQWKHIQAHWRDTQIEEASEKLVAARSGQLGELENIAEGFSQVLDELKNPGEKGPRSRVKDGTSDEVKYRRQVDLIQRLQAEIEAELSRDEGLRKKLEEKNNASYKASEADRSLRAYRGDFQAAKFTFEEAKKHLLADGPTEDAQKKAGVLSENFNKDSVKVLNDKLFAKEKTENLAEIAGAAYDEALKSLTEVGEGEGRTDFAALQVRLKGSLLIVDSALAQFELVDASMRNAIRNAPLLDFMAPSYKIDKVVTPGLKEPLNFLDVDRVHRCKTCHINIDDPDPRFVGHQDEKWGSVYASHPRLDLFLSAASPHSYQDSGCTTCHYGDGHALDFAIAAHTPADEEQGKEWGEKYHWHAKHYEEHPMLPTSFTSSSCTKCHNEQWDVEGAERLNLGKKLVRTYGCFGCHTIEGFEIAAGASDDRVWKLNKVGPSLKHLGDKVSMDYLTRWIREPGHFRESSRMPRFFDLTNSSGEMLRPLGSADDKSGDSEKVDFTLRNSIEVLSLSTYLFKNSVGEKGPGDGTAPAGDPARGRELVKTLGCMGCHSIKVESEAEYEEPLPALSTVLAALGEKAGGAPPKLAAAYTETSKNLSALYDWLRRLDVGEELEELYSRTRRSIERSQGIEEKLEMTESAVENAGLLADAVYNRWVHNTFGPDLSPLARKFDLSSEAGRGKAASWLSGWILNPQEHDPETIMPRFRLASAQDPSGEQKVADMVSYLLTLDYNDVDLAVRPSVSRASLRGSEKEKKDRDENWQGLATTSVGEIDGDDEKKAILDDIASFYLRAAHGTVKANDLLKGNESRELSPMTTSEKLDLVGHRLVRRYGCFGCHNGIRDRDPDPGAVASDRIAYFDSAQPIGAELNKWGNKGSDRLDFGQWGHQEDGTEAIPHQRHKWAIAKLSDTRRFDVLPRRVAVGTNSSGKPVYSYKTTKQLVHKGADELLKMPLFPFHDKPEQVDAIVAYVISLVADPVDPGRKKHLSQREKILEGGSRLVQKLNCSGCHRLGATTSYVSLDDLPNPSGEGDEISRTSTMQQETWLARSYRLAARPAGPSGENLGIELPAGFPIDQLIGQYNSGDAKADAALPQVFSSNEEMSVVDAARRHFYPLPGFVHDLVKAIDSIAIQEEDVSATTANTGIYDFVSKRGGFDGGQWKGAGVVARLGKAYNDADSEAGQFLTSMLEAPYDQDLDAVPGSLGVSKSDFENLALQYYSAGENVLAEAPESERKLAVKGYGEGGVRFYFGTQRTERFKAPPPLLRQGERVKSDWFFHFLQDVQPIRPWLKIRMPSFNLTQDEARLIVQWFKTVSEVPYGEELFAEDKLDQEQARKGQLLFGKGSAEAQGKQCNQCHPRGLELPTLPILTQGGGTIEPAEVPLSAPGDSHFLVWKDAAGKVLLEGGFASPAAAQAAGGKLGDKAASWAIGKPWNKSSWGPDLNAAAGRLRVQWMRDWLYFPPDFMPGTKMPNYFQNREKFTGNPAIEIDAKDLSDVNALLQYLRHMNDEKMATAPREESQEEAGGGQ